MVLLVLSGCSYLPAQREKDRAAFLLKSIDSVSEVHLSCGGGVLASDSLCAEVLTKDGAKLRFDHVGFNSFGSTATNVFVAEAGGLVPRVASCDGRS